MSIGTNDTVKAAPERGTIKQIAVCKHCSETLEKSPVSREWYHMYTSETPCFVESYGYQARHSG